MPIGAFKLNAISNYLQSAAPAGWTYNSTSLGTLTSAAFANNSVSYIGLDNSSRPVFMVAYRTSSTHYWQAFRINSDNTITTGTALTVANTTASRVSVAGNFSGSRYKISASGDTTLYAVGASYTSTNVITYRGFTITTSSLQITQTTATITSSSAPNILTGVTCVNNNTYVIGYQDDFTQGHIYRMVTWSGSTLSTVDNEYNGGDTSSDGNILGISPPGSSSYSRFARFSKFGAFKNHFTYVTQHVSSTQYVLDQGNVITNQANDATDYKIINLADKKILYAITETTGKLTYKPYLFNINDTATAPTVNTIGTQYTSTETTHQKICTGFTDNNFFRIYNSGSDLVVIKNAVSGGTISVDTTDTVTAETFTDFSTRNTFRADITSINLTGYNCIVGIGQVGSALKVFSLKYS